MPLWIAILLGVVQGFTEFLPVSSSGHLALLQNVLDFSKYGVDHITFDILLHLGTLAAVFAAFWKDIVELVRGALGLVFDRFQCKGKPERRLVVLLLIATVPLVVGALLENLVESMFQSTLFIGCALLVTAAMLWLSCRFAGGGKTAATAKNSDAVRVGLMQLLALFPGISRSGSTICGGLLSGFGRDFAVSFAFLMSIPAVLGAVVLKLPKMFAAGVAAENVLPYAAGFIVSAVSGYAAIRLVRLLMKKNSFRYFAVYCAVLGAAVIILTIL